MTKMNQDNKTPAIRYSFESGAVRIYVGDVLRLETRWTGPRPSFPETDSRLKKWAAYLVEDSDESVEKMGGPVGLIDEGFEQGNDHVWRLETKQGTRRKL